MTETKILYRMTGTCKDGHPTVREWEHKPGTKYSDGRFGTRDEPLGFAAGICPVCQNHVGLVLSRVETEA